MTSTPTTTHPIPWETLVAYWAGDLDTASSDRLEEHLFGCDECSALAERVAAVTEALRTMIPAFLSPAQLAALRASRLRIEDNPLSPGERKTAAFMRDVDVLLHRLRGLDLSSAERVSVTIRIEETGDVLIDEPSVPFDATSSEVLVACQRHFAVFPPNIVVEVRAREASGKERSASYPIPHVFHGDPGGR